MSCFKHEIKPTYKEDHFEWEIEYFFSETDVPEHIQVKNKIQAFLFRETRWVINLCQDRYSDILRLFVTCDEYSDAMEVESVIALKKVDGSLDYSLMLNDGEKYDGYYYIYSCTDSKLLERKHELTTSHSLTIVCLMKGGTSYYYPQPTICESPSLKLIELDTLSDNFKNFFDSKGSCDVTFHIKGKVFKAHKTVLMARSSAFSAMFKHDMKGKETCIINIHDCDPEYFHEFLEYIYCGKLENISFPGVLHLYTASNKYVVQELKSFCIEYMERCLTEDNVCDVIMLAEKNAEAKLLSLARGFFFKNATKIVNTPKWKSLLENNSDMVNKLIIEMGSKIHI